MPNRKLFLSYSRGERTTPAMRRLHDHCQVQLKSRRIEAFFDQRSIDAGAPWAEEIDAFMAEAEFFLAFISIDFWKSRQCQRELGLALARYEQPPAPGAKRLPRLLFVLAGRLDPNDLEIDAPEGALDRMDGAGAPLQRIRRLGQISFLGPYDEVTGRLVRLRFEDDLLLDDQIAGLVQAIKALADQPA